MTCGWVIVAVRISADVHRFSHSNTQLLGFKGACKQLNRISFNLNMDKQLIYWEQRGRCSHYWLRDTESEEGDRIGSGRKIISQTVELSALLLSSYACVCVCVCLESEYSCMYEMKQLLPEWLHLPLCSENTHHHYTT